MKRIHAIAYGRVQGVCFRENTSNKAIELGLKGYVKNLPDGAVEIIAEGPGDKLNELIEFCKSNPGSSDVSKVDIKEEKATNNFKEFGIKY